MTNISNPLKYPGGKGHLASKIVSLIPPHLTYCEPFAGGLSVLLAKNPDNVSEVVNDLNGVLTNFWQVLQDPTKFELFRRRIEATPFSEFEYNTPCTNFVDYSINNAITFFIKARMSLAGRTTTFAPISTSRLRRRMNEQVSAWLSCIEGLEAVHNRLKRVFIYQRDALNVIEQVDHVNTAIYCDPPYMHSTRTTKTEYGQFEMTDEDHIKLLEKLLVCKSKILLSGYESDLYNNILKGWNIHRFEIANSASGSKVKRKMIECLWLNF